MNRRTLLGGLATLPALLGGNGDNNERGETTEEDGRGLNLSLSLENTEGESTAELKAGNPTTHEATITTEVDTENYPHGRLPTLTLSPGETQTTGLGTNPPHGDYPDRVELSVVVEWD